MSEKIINSNTDQDKVVSYRREGENDRYIAKKYANVSTDLIEITESNLKFILKEYGDSMEKNLSLKKSYITPLTLFITFLVTVLTATFKDFSIIKKEHCETFFVLCMIGALVWLAVVLMKIYKQKNKKPSIDDLINKIKNIKEEHNLSLSKYFENIAKNY